MTEHMYNGMSSIICQIPDEGDKTRAHVATAFKFLHNLKMNISNGK